MVSYVKEFVRLRLLLSVGTGIQKNDKDWYGQ